MGFGIDTGIASANEVRTAQANNHPSAERPTAGEMVTRTAAPASPHYPHVSSDKPRGLATDAQLRLLNTMLKERGLPMPAAGITFSEASDEIGRLKNIPKAK
jgi:hypothetical protein